MPDRRPAQVWRGPAVSCMSVFSTPITDFPIILRKTSPIPIGLTPGLPSLSKPLSSGISLQATNSLRQHGLMCSVHSRLARFDIASASWIEALLYDLLHSMCFQISVSTWVGPPDPWRFWLDFCIDSAVIPSKITTSGAGAVSGRRASGCAASAFGCFLARIVLMLSDKV